MSVKRSRLTLVRLLSNLPALFSSQRALFNSHSHNLLRSRLGVLLREDPQAIDLLHAVRAGILQDHVAVGDLHALSAHQFYYEVVEALAVEDDHAVARVVCARQLAHEERAFGANLLPSLRLGREGVDDGERRDLYDALDVGTVAAQNQEVQLGVGARGRRRNESGGVVCEGCCVGLIVVGDCWLGLELCCAGGSLLGWHCCGDRGVCAWVARFGSEFSGMLCFAPARMLLFRVQLTFGPRVINRAE